METKKKIKTFKDLQIWQKAMNLSYIIYKMVKKLPKEERYSLSDQMRRAAISVPSNIAEGYGRYSSKEYARFLTFARGSAYELESQLLLCQYFGFFTEAETNVPLTLITELSKMLTSLINKPLPPKYSSTQPFLNN